MSREKPYFVTIFSLLFEKIHHGWMKKATYAQHKPLQTVEKPFGRYRRDRSPSDFCSYRPALPVGRGVYALARKHSDSSCRKRSPQASFFDTLKATYAQHKPLRV